MRKYLHSFFTFSVICILLSGCQPPSKDILIYFENDVHCAVETYSEIAALRDSALKHTPYVSVVSAGDFVQGDVIGSLSQGEYIIDIMNTVPYDVITIGNHEFDYGIEQQKRLFDRLTADIVCCNMSTVPYDGEESRWLYPAYVIRQYGDVRVAFIGVATPTTMLSSTPTYFMDALGHVLYDFHTEDTYALVQSSAEKARQEGADYVVVISHLGDDTPFVNSVELIHRTKGIDIVLDGHAHHLLNRLEANVSGDSIRLVSTGSKGATIGELCIQEDSTMQVNLLKPRYTQCPERLPKRVEKKISEVKAALDEQVRQVVGYSEVDLLDRDAQQNRLVRWQETNLSDFVADAMREVGGGQIGVIHGGSLRASILQGPISLGDLIALMPFNNHLAKVSMTGQQLLDAMEVSVATYPIESGDFHICSHLRYEIDSTIPSSVIWDEQKMFAGIGSTRRITCMEVAMPDGSWQKIDPNETYIISGLDYTLRNLGAAGMFRYATPMAAQDMKDTDILLRYIHILGDTIRSNQYPEDLNERRFVVK